MAHRFMEQNARPARAKHHRHRSRWRRLGIEIDQRLAHGTFGVSLQHLVGEIAVIIASATASVSLLAASILLRDDGQANVHERSYVSGHHAVASRDHHHIVFTRKPTHYLFDAWINVAGKLFKPLQNTHLVGIGKRRNRIGRRIQRTTSFRLRLGRLRLTVSTGTCDAAGGGCRRR